MDTRDSNGRFTKGSVGNPKGRPKKKPETPTPENVLASATMEAVTRLIDLVHSDNEAIALQAALAVLDKTLGRNRKFISVPDGVQKMIMSWSDEDVEIKQGIFRYKL